MTKEWKSWRECQNEEPDPNYAFGLSTEGKGQGGKHDAGPWPDALQGTSGLMAESAESNWLRREDWKEATQNAANYE